MSRDPRYQRLLNSREWKTLRRDYLQRHPLCERCQREGYVTSAVDVHHKQPVESAKTEHEMRLLAYSPTNLEALCIPCHVKTHQEARSHTKEKVRENRQQRLQRWLEHNGQLPKQTDDRPTD